MVRKLPKAGSSDGQRNLGVCQRRYARARRFERLFRRGNSLANDALLVVLEWGPAMRLPEPWRLEQRQPKESVSRREAALAEALEVKDVAYELTAVAWPRDRREVPSEVVHTAKLALEALTSQYPDLDRGSLRRAVNQANYAHAK
jgi:hypothetical protein